MDTVDRIFGLLDQMNMEQQEFARIVGVSDDTASNWRRRKSASYTKYLPKIAEVLKTTVEYLLSGKEKELTAPEDGEPIHTITFNRNGKVIKKQYSAEKWEAIIKMLDAIPEDRLP